MTMLVIRCPTACNRKLRSVEASDVATSVVKRKCGACKTCWQLVVTPMKRADGGQKKMHKLEWVALID